MAGGQGSFRPGLDAPVLVLQTSPQIIRLAVMMYIRVPLSLWNVQDLLHERGSTSAMSVGIASSNSS